MEGISANYVADSFVKQYYAVLNKCPESLYKFYKESSVLSWPGPDGVVTPVTTSIGINDKIVSSDYVKWFVETATVDAQDSVEGGIVVAVTGFLTGKDNARKNFFQTFFLAKQDNGFFVLNDILHIFDDYINDQAAAPFMQNSVPSFTVNHIASSKTEDAIENGNVEEVNDISFSSDIAATVAMSATSVDPLENLGLTPEPASDIKGDVQETDQPAPSNTESAVENGNLKEVVDLSISNDTAASVTASTSSVDPQENSSSIPDPASDFKGDVQETDQLAPSNTEYAVENGNVKEVVDLSISNDAAATVAASTSSVDPQENSSSIHDPASDIKEDFASANTKDTFENGNIKEETDASVSEETSAVVAGPKFSYASVVAKGRAGTPLSGIPLNADNRAVSPLPAKVSAAPSNTDDQAVAPQTTKVSASAAAGASKISPQPNNANPKLPVHSNGVTNSTSHVEAATTGIYIGRLPIDIDRQGILKVVSKFGQVRKGLDGIQIRRHEDGFCCGFVEFESADSARHAVEARRVNFGERESYISYKKSSYRGSNVIGRSPSTGGFQNRNPRTRENSQISKRISNKQQSGDNRGQV